MAEAELVAAQDPAPAAPDQEETPKRETILPQPGKKQPPIAWTSWALLAGTFAAGLVIFFFTYGLILAPWLRWGVTLSWVGLGVGFAVYDLGFLSAKPGTIDEKSVDRWTIVHTGAGIVFGAWYLPIWVVLVFTLFWEFFEINVKGFGEKEIFQNRVIDVAVAFFGWWLVVSVVMATTRTGTPFPLLSGR